MHSIRFAKNYCGEAEDPVPYLLLIDDDYFLNTRNLVRELRRHTVNERLYAGYRSDTSPFRLSFQKFAIPLSDYPFALYPPFITGGSVLLTRQSISEFYHSIQHTQLFRFDDVYAGLWLFFSFFSKFLIDLIFAGILAYLLGINALNLNDKFPISYVYYPHRTVGPSEALLWKTTLIAAHGFAPLDLIEKWPYLKPSALDALVDP